MPLPEGVGRRLLCAGGAGLLAAPFLAIPSGARAQQETAIRGRDGWLFAPWDRLDRVDLTNIPRVCEIIGEAMRMVRAAGIEVVLALIPAKATIYRDMMPPEMPPSREALGRYALIHRSLQEQRAGWLPDLLSPMLQARAARPDQRLFFRADTHWTAAGAELCAAEVARFIRAQIPLPPPPGPGERLGPPVVRTRSRADLLPFLPAAERRNYPPEEYLIRAPVRAGAGGLVGEDRADVMALGSSFLAPEFNFSPALSAGLGRPVALEWRVANIGPYATLTGYLGSQLFRRQRPRLLVMSLLEQPMVLLPGNRSAFPEHAMSADSFLDRVREALAARLCGGHDTAGMTCRPYRAQGWCGGCAPKQRHTSGRTGPSGGEISGRWYDMPTASRAGWAGGVYGSPMSRRRVASIAPPRMA